MTTVSGPAWRPKTAAGCWPAVVPRVGSASRSRLPARNSLPRRLTLTGKLQIQQLLDTGKRQSGRYMTAVAAPAESFRYALLVGKRLGSAAVRNRAKRMLRESIRLELDTWPPLHLGLFPKSNLLDASLAELRRDLRTILDRLDA